MSIKQVIVMRTQYPDGHGGLTGLRKGKLIAQGAHASIAFLTRRLQRQKAPKFTKPEQEWMETSFAKVCVGVNSEEELLDIYQQAKDAMLEVHMVTDSGKTEFHGEPTRTCLAIGPDYSEKIDKITGHLKLL